MEKTFRLFISSTFSDFHAERKALQHIVFPRLENLCKGFGADFEAIDLRWGITEEAQKSNETMRICLEEIRRCQRLSPKPNFAVLLGDRYGWQPLPSQIPLNHWKWIMAFGSRHDRNLIKKYYQGPDRNSIPPVFKLRSSLNKESDGNLRTSELQNALRKSVNAAGFIGKDRLPYFASATHQEIALGALDPLFAKNASEHIRIYIRHIKEVVSSSKYKTFFDWDSQSNSLDHYSKKALYELESQLRSSFKNNIRDYTTTFVSDSISTSHIKLFCEDFFNDQHEIIEQELKSIKTRTRLDLQLEETEFFEKNLCQNFRGRTQQIKQIEQYISQSDNSSPLFITGNGGTGKSALIAKIIQNQRVEKRSNSVNKVVISRYIGAISGSETIANLLLGLINEISDKYNLPRKTVSTEIEELFSSFILMLNQSSTTKPLVLAFDGLDQLDKSDQSIFVEKIPLNLSSSTRIVIACRCDSEIYTFINDRFPTSELRLPSLSIEEADDILNAWVSDIREAHYSPGLSPYQVRSISKKQRKKILKQFKKSGQVLWLKLAAEEIRHWTSWHKDCDLAPTIQGMISNILNRHILIQKKHPYHFTKSAIAYITNSQRGLSETEIKYALSTDSDVQNEFSTQANKTGQSWSKGNTLPTIYWSRLFFDLQPYLSVAIRDGMTIYNWFHREFRDVLLEEISKGEGRDHKEIHNHLASMFYMRAPQEDDLYLYTDISCKPSKSALRRVMEQPYHLASAGKTSELINLLKSFGFCLAKCAANRSNELIFDLRLIPDSYLLSESEKEWFVCLKRWSLRLSRGDKEWPSHQILYQLTSESLTFYKYAYSAEYHPLSNKLLSSLEKTSYIEPFATCVQLSKSSSLTIQRIKSEIKELAIHLANKRWLIFSNADGSFELYDLKLSLYIGRFSNKEVLLSQPCFSNISSSQVLNFEAVVPVSMPNEIVINPYGCSVNIHNLEIILGSSDVIYLGIAGNQTIFYCDNLIYFINVDNVANRHLSGIYLADGSKINSFGQSHLNYNRFELIAFFDECHFISLGWEKSHIRDEIKIEIFKITEKSVNLISEVLVNDGIDLPLGLFGKLEDGRIVFTSENFLRSYCFDPLSLSQEDCLMLWPGLSWKKEEMKEEKSLSNHYEGDPKTKWKVKLTKDQWGPDKNEKIISLIHHQESLEEGTILLWKGMEEIGDISDDEFVLTLVEEVDASQNEIDAYINELTINPNNANTHNKLGEEMGKAGDFHGAISNFSKAIEINPEIGVFYHNRGIAKSRLSDYKSAIEDFTKALKFDPENEDSYLYRANTKFSIGDLKGFQEDYDKTKVMASKKGLKWYEGQHLKWVSDVRIEKAVRLQDGRCLVIKQSGPILLTKKAS